MKNCCESVLAVCVAVLHPTIINLGVHGAIQSCVVILHENNHPTEDNHVTTSDGLVVSLLTLTDFAFGHLLLSIALDDIDQNIKYGHRQGRQQVLMW